jgi:ubiquitin carboxyl-terminal hydrolase 8
MKMVTGGAELEMVEDDDGNKMPLLLLNRVQQIMVQVEQEIDSSTSDNPTIDYSDDKSLDTLATLDTVKPQPPFLRWVDLYGEEVCEVGTHMKISSDGRDLGVATLQYEVESHRKPVEIMKSFNNMYGQGFMKESLRGTPPAPGSVGMHNLGNSCFINSIIQCLNHMEPLTQYFLEGTYANDLNRKNPLGSGGRVATAYSALLKEVWSGKYSALAPRMLKQTVASFAPQFNNSFQHDSQEFCQFLMDGLHEDCNRVKNKPYVEELEGLGMEDSKAAIETWKKHLLRHDSIIVDRCQGMHRSHLTCTKCGRESIKFDAFCTISLPLIADKGDQGMNIQDCIEKFLEGEQLDELNAWYCPSCKKHVCALKMIALWSVPDILILHLKRFTFDHCSVRNDVIRSKINDTVRFPIERLDLTKHVLGPIDEDAPPIYRVRHSFPVFSFIIVKSLTSTDSSPPQHTHAHLAQLYGVSEHVGPTANSGHYTATVRNSKDDRWFRYNDAHVGETTADAAVTGGAYLLFYERAKGRARWGGMEKMIADNGGLHTDQDGFTTVTSKKKKHG